jgi:YVTN family beta-propeller protein
VVTGPSPGATAVNPVTNRIYVATYFGSVAVIDGATNRSEAVSAGTTPFAAAVNPATNKIYVANADSSSVTVIDGATNATVTVPAGATPIAVAINPVTNMIYVANENSNTVTVIDGATNETFTVPVGTAPDAVAVNPFTNKIYVANILSGNVTVIDGATNTTITVPAGTQPIAVAVNPLTNKIYVVNNVSANVTVIDGATNSTSTVGVGTYPQTAAVNQLTNKIYVANAGNGTVTMIDGATNEAVAVANGIGPHLLAVNPVTNKIYVGNNTDITVIDGTTNATVTVPLGITPWDLAVNPTTNKIYIADINNNNVMVIDGVTNSTSTASAGAGPVAAVVNPVTNKIYVANRFSNDITVITEQQVQAIPLSTTIAPLPGDITVQRTPHFTFTSSNTFSPTAPPVQNVYYQLDTWQGQWLRASGAADAFDGSAPPLSVGTHIIFAYATDGQDAGSTQTGSGNSVANNPLTGSIQAYLFTVVQAATTTSVMADINPVAADSPVTFTAMVVVNAPGVGTPTGTVKFLDNGVTIPGAGAVSVGGMGHASFQSSGLSAGSHSITAVYSGNADFLGSASSALSEVVGAATTTAITSAMAVTYGTVASVTVSVSSASTPTGSVTLSVDGGAATSLAIDGSGSATFDLGILPAGSHTLAANYAQQNNFFASSTAGSIMVNQASLTITTNNAARSYGAADPAFTGTVGATQNGDVITATYATAATETSSVGSYSIVPIPAGAALANYNVSLVNGALTVNKAALTVTANNKSRVYGAANPAFDGVIAGIQNGDAITASFASPATATSSVGSYAIVPTPSGAALANYNVSLVSGTLTISQAASSTTVVSGNNPALVGAPVTFTATVSSIAATPTGTVSFKDGSTTMGTALLNGSGVATFTSSTLAQGTHSMTAVYDGGVNFVGSTSSALAENVCKGNLHSCRQ